MKEGRYSELAFAEYINHSPYTEKSKIRILGENDKTLIDGTINVKATWEPYNLNGHSVYKAVLDMGAISKKAKTFIDTIYGVFVDDRYMIPAMPTNFKNPTDPTTGNKDNPEPNTIWAKSDGAPYTGPAQVTPSLVNPFIPSDSHNNGNILSFCPVAKLCLRT